MTIKKSLSLDINIGPPSSDYGTVTQRWCQTFLACRCEIPLLNSEQSFNDSCFNKDKLKLITTEWLWDIYGSLINDNTPSLNHKTKLTHAPSSFCLCGIKTHSKILDILVYIWWDQTNVPAIDSVSVQNLHVNLIYDDKLYSGNINVLLHFPPILDTYLQVLEILSRWRQGPFTLHSYSRIPWLLMSWWCKWLR